MSLQCVHGNTRKPSQQSDYDNNDDDEGLRALSVIQFTFLIRRCITRYKVGDIENVARKARLVGWLYSTRPAGNHERNLLTICTLLLHIICANRSYLFRHNTSHSSERLQTAIPLSMHLCLKRRRLRELIKSDTMSFTVLQCGRDAVALPPIF